jgi:hypothetical protein
MMYPEITIPAMNPAEPLENSESLGNIATNKLTSKKTPLRISIASLNNRSRIADRKVEGKKTAPTMYNATTKIIPPTKLVLKLNPNPGPRPLSYKYAVPDRLRFEVPLTPSRNLCVIVNSRAVRRSSRSPILYQLSIV